MGKLRVWCGIDPGSTGAICAIREDGKVIFLDTTVAPLELLDWFNALADECDVLVVMVENVHNIRGAASKSTFSFGWNTCKVEVMPLAAGLSVDKVNPKQWQKTVGVKSTTKGKAIKKEVASICARLYPRVNLKGPKGGLLDGRSDALMIAHYAKLKYR